MTEQIKHSVETVLGGDDWSNFVAATNARDWAQSVALAKRMIRARPADLVGGQGTQAVTALLSVHGLRIQLPTATGLVT